MKINGINLGYYNMNITKFSYQPCVAKRELFQAEKSIYPILGKIDIKPKQMVLEAEFSSYNDVSQFMLEIVKNKEVILDIDDGFIYKCYLEQLSSPVTYFDNGWYDISIPLFVIKTGIIRTKRLNYLENYVHIDGDLETECIFEITPKKDIDLFTIYGVSIKNMKKDVKVTIDGIEKRVYSDIEVNKYGDCSFIKNFFPVINPGKSIITMSHLEADVYLKYMPLYI